MKKEKPPGTRLKASIAQQESHNKCSKLYSSDSAAHLQITGEERGAFGFGQPGDLLEGEKVVHVDVVLCRRKTFSGRSASWLTGFAHD